MEVILISTFLLFCMFSFSLVVGEGTSSAAPILIVGSAHNVSSPAVPQTPDDVSFEFAPSPALLKEQKETVKIMLHGITHTLTSGNLLQLAYCRRAADNIFNMNWAPLDISPLRAIFDELFAYLESLKDLHNLGPAALFQQEVGQRLINLRAQVEIKRKELDIPIIAQDETLAALSTLRVSIERTRLMLADLEQRYEVQQLKFEERSSRIQACQYSFSITQNELKDFEAMLNECLGADWHQQEEALQIQRYVAAKKQMLKRHIEDFNTKYQAFHDTYVFSFSLLPFVHQRNGLQ